MDEILSNLANKIAEISNKRKALANAIDKGIKIKHKIDDIDLGNLKICGIDGGFLKKDYHGARLILRRAVAACFNFTNGKLESCEYLPNSRPFPEAIIVNPEYSDQEFNVLSNLKREEIELEMALEAIEKFRPDIIIRDGSIILHPSSAILATSSIYKTYANVTELFKQLYSECERRDILLVGAIEDSKGQRYCNYLNKKIIPEVLNSNSDQKVIIAGNMKILDNTTDSLFLYYLLDINERTESITYTDLHLPDFESWNNKLFVTYIKPVDYDRPLRLDFISKPENLNETTKKITEIVCKISKHNRNYSYPSVLIEADARAKLTDVEIEHFKSALAEKLGNNPTLMELRREGRPL